MLFGYSCEKCGKRFDKDFRIGKAPRSAVCEKCGSVAKRLYEATGLAIVVDGRPSTSRWGEQMRRKNDDAAYRMKGRKAPKLVGYDYGGGKVVEAR